MASALAHLKPPLRILHVITGLDVGGAESMLSALARSAPEYGLEHRVVSLKSNGFHAATLRAAGVSVTELGLAASRPNPLALWRLARLIARAKPALVQGWLYHGDLAALLGLALSGRRGVTPLAWSLRCSELAQRAYGPGLRLAIGACTTLSHVPEIVVANSEAGLSAHLARGYRPRRSAVIWNGIDLVRFAPDPAKRAATRRALGIAEGKKVVAHVARLDPMKDHETLLAALARLPDVSCLAIGAGTEALPDLPNLLRLGRREDVPSLLAAADLVISSSAFGEGFSNALAEGMAAGLPCVATDVGDARILVGETGVVVPPRSPERLAAAIAGLFAEETVVWRRRSEASRRRIAERFSLARATTDFAQLYRNLCEPLVTA
jgi:glycosyltransferase involved in cell wall biosynthesis